MESWLKKSNNNGNKPTANDVEATVEVDASLTGTSMKVQLHQSTAASTWWCDPRPQLGWVE